MNEPKKIKKYIVRRRNNERILSILRKREKALKRSIMTQQKELIWVRKRMVYYL